MPNIVISEPDIEAAVTHLRSLPVSLTTSLPRAWARQRFLSALREVVQANPQADGALAVAPGVWALVKPFGVDLAGPSLDHDPRRQVWILIRSAHTDPSRIESITV